MSIFRFAKSSTHEFSLLMQKELKDFTSEGVNLEPTHSIPEEWHSPSEPIAGLLASFEAPGVVEETGIIQDIVDRIEEASPSRQGEVDWRDFFVDNIDRIVEYEVPADDRALVRSGEGLAVMSNVVESKPVSIMPGDFLEMNDLIHPLGGGQVPNPSDRLMQIRRPLSPPTMVHFSPMAQGFGSSGFDQTVAHGGNDSFSSLSRREYEVRHARNRFCPL